jgi:exodeoxyribonuclease VII large subunit
MLSARVQRAGRFHLMQARHRYAQLSSESVLTRLRDEVNRRDQRLDELRFRLNAAARGRLRVPAKRIALLTELLRRQDLAVRLVMTHRRLQSAVLRLQRTTNQVVAERQTRLNRASTRLETLSPLSVLARGYALVYNADGTLVRSTADTAVGDTIHARIANGTLEARITHTQTDTPENSK